MCCSRSDWKTATPEVALSIVQWLPAEMLSRAHFSYYEGLFRAVDKIAEAALRNVEKPNDPRGMPV